MTTNEDNSQNIVPTKKEFLEFFNNFPKGNPKRTYEMVKFHITSKLTFIDTKVTWELLKYKYSEYLSKCASEQTQDKYIKSFEGFVKDDDYNCSFNAINKKGSFIDNLLK